MKVHSINKEAIFTIMDLGGLIKRPDDLDRVLQFLVEKVCQLTKTDACSLFLYQPENQTLLLKATHGLNKKMADNFTFPYGEGLVGKTMKLLKPISISNAQKSKNFLRVEELGEEQYKSFLSVPLIYNNQPIGVISVQTKKLKAFTKKEIEFLMTLAIPAVSLIEKAKFMDAVQPLSAPPKKANQVVIQKPISKDPDKIIKGIAAVSGIVMGRVKIISDKVLKESDDNKKFNLKTEINRLKKAFKSVSEQIRETKKQAEAKFGPDEASIFQAYLLFLESDTFKQQIIHEIKKGLVAEEALDHIVKQYMDRMSMAQDEYIKERAYDIQDISRKLSDYLIHGQSSQKNPFNTSDNAIFLKEYWSISDFIHIPEKQTLGILSPNGGASSHISILAGTMNLPAIVGLGSSASQIQDGDFIILDSFSGDVILNPSEETKNIYAAEIKELERRKKLYRKQRKLKVKLKDKSSFTVGANLGMPSHAAIAIDAGADAVGLYRTEFPFLMSNNMPTEEEQFEMYCRVIKLMQGKEIVFRTLDIGGDKYVPYLNLPQENNPALGWRAIRFSLERKDLFRIQLRALLRASAFGKIRILLPMITGVEEVIEIKDILDSVKNELQEEGKKTAKKIPLGIMIEVPAAIEIADKLAKHVDYFSLGTNDLIQYGLAVDRTNPLVSSYFEPFHPALLRMIHKSIKAAYSAGIEMNVCGDLAANPYLTTILIGMGARSVSVIPRSIPKIKHLARNLPLDEAEKLCKKILKQSEIKKIKELAKDFFEKHNLSSTF